MDVKIFPNLLYVPLHCYIFVQYPCIWYLTYNRSAIFVFDRIITTEPIRSIAGALGQYSAIDGMDLCVVLAMQSNGISVLYIIFQLPTPIPYW